ncbi:MAG: hypothetical protein AB7Q00_00920 [Phycisphaerales bacterium]
MDANLTITLAATTPEGEWYLGIGDPTVWGWLSTAMYFVTAWLCWRAWRRERAEQGRDRGGLKPEFWAVLGVLVLLLGINKQLDLQTWMTSVARKAAKSEGWYTRRHEVQLVFLAVMGIAGVGGVGVVAWSLRRVWRRYWLGMAGMAALLAYVALRASSFHRLDDVLLRLPVVERFFSRGLEAMAVGTVGFAAWRARKTNAEEDGG